MSQARRGVWKLKLTPYKWCALVVVVAAAVVLQEVADPLEDYQYGFVAWLTLFLLVVYGDDVLREAARSWHRVRTWLSDLL
jgi:hypothetical protein